MHEEIGADRYGRTQCGSPHQIDRGDRERPIPYSGEIGEVVRGIGNESKECTQWESFFPRAFAESRWDDEYDQAHDEDNVKQESGTPIDLTFHQITDLLCIETPRDESEPDRVEGDEEGEGDSECFQEVHRLVVKNYGYVAVKARAYLYGKSET